MDNRVKFAMAALLMICYTEAIIGCTYLTAKTTINAIEYVVSDE